MTNTQDEKLDAVVKAARVHARHCSSPAIDKALSALDETPEARVVRCAREWCVDYRTRWDHDDPEPGLVPTLNALYYAVRALPPAEL